MKKTQKIKLMAAELVLFVLSVSVSVANIAFASSASIKILSPVSGDAWRIGETHTISWKSRNLSKAGIKELGIFIQNDNVGGSGNSMYITPNGERIPASKNSYTWTIEPNQILLNDGSKYMKKFDINIFGYDEAGNQQIMAESKGKFTIIPTGETITGLTSGQFELNQCVKTQQMISERRSYFWNKGNEYTTAYTNLTNSINNSIANIDEAKLDTATVKSYVTKLQEKIDKFIKDFNLYSDSLVATGKTLDNACQRPKTEFKEKLLKSQTLLQTVRADVVEIRTYVNEAVIPEIKTLKLQLQ